jgi:hypothetical protein
MDEAAPSELPDVTSGSLIGLKFFKPISILIATLHALHPSPNRTLHYDEYMSMLLLFYFNPILKSLRGIQRASNFKSVQKALGVTRAALGTLSAAARVFDPAPLRAIFCQLAEKAALLPQTLPRPSGVPADLRLLAADGTLWTFLPRMARWFWTQGPRKGVPPGFKAHVQFDILTSLPDSFSLGAGFSNERRALEAALKAACFYIMDRGYVDFALFQAIIDIKSSFLCRVCDNLVLRTVEARAIGAAAASAGVFSDEIAWVGCATLAANLRQPLRVIKARRRQSRPTNISPRGGTREGDIVEMTLVTDRLDMSAEEIVNLYRYRWQIEIFFRWLKCTLNCEHLLSHSENGFELQLYAAMIGSMLIALYTGRKTNRATLEALQFYLCGMITEEELAEHLRQEKLKQERSTPAAK